MRKRGLLALLGATGGATLWFARRRRAALEETSLFDESAREPLLPEIDRRSEPDHLALSSPPLARVQLDIERLRGLPSAKYEPLVEYLDYIQVKRGENKTLMFVRTRDLDALAKMTGDSKDDLVNEFQQMGVLLSMN